MARVFILGIAVVDFVFSVETLPDQAKKYRAKAAEIVGGGCAANAAVAIARLGGEAALAARLGDDATGDMILRDLNAEGVDTTLVQKTPGARSSFSSVYVDGQGERQIMNFRGSELTEDTSWIKTAPPTDAVLADTRWAKGALSALELAGACGVPGVLDAEAPVDEALMSHASHVAFSRDGLLSLTGGNDPERAIKEVAAALPGWVCVTDGARGVWYAEAGRADGISHVPAFQVEVRDTLAAGDVWHGAFTLALAEGRNERDAICFANAAAALKCVNFGGRAGSPSRSQLENFLKEHAQWN